MILKNYKDIYKGVAEDTGLSYDIVEAIGEFTWEDLNNRVSGFENREIYVFKLGTFKFRKKKGTWLLDNLKRALPAVSCLPDPERREKSLKSLNEKIEKVEKLLGEWDELLDERFEFKKEKYGPEAFNRSFSKSEQDLGRPEKPDFQKRARRSNLRTKSSDMQGL